MSPRSFFELNGFTLLRNVYSHEAAKDIALRVAEQADLASGQHLTAPDATNRFTAALHALTSFPILRAVRQMIGIDAKFLQLSDLHQAHNADGWHRDNVTRDFSRGEDWNESNAKYDIAKLILYLQVSDFALAVISGSHRTAVTAPEDHLVFSSAIMLSDEHIVSNQRFNDGQVILISPKAGDAILFDERMLHCGRPYAGEDFTPTLSASKLTLCWVFGTEGAHAHRFHSYFRFIRAGYESLNNSARILLMSANLLPSFIDDDYFRSHPSELNDVFFSDPPRMAPAVRDMREFSAPALRQVYDNNQRVRQLEGICANRTAYVVGSGPSLARLLPEWRAELENRPSIGLNRSTYLIKTSHFISAYISECLLARFRNPEGVVINIRPVIDVPLVDGILSLRRIFSEDPEAIGTKFDRDWPSLFTRNNAMFAATHLALIMGASKVCYVGVEQRNGLHFYNKNEEIRRLIFNDLQYVLKNYHDIIGVDHPYEHPYEMFRRLFESPRDLEERRFYDMDHAVLLGHWQAFARKAMNVSFASAVADSVVCDAGAPYQPVAHMLEQDWSRERASAPMTDAGFVDRLVIENGRVELSGWAIDLIERRPVAEVLVMAGDELVLRATPDGHRPDVVAQFANADFSHSGFRAHGIVPSCAGSDHAGDLRAYGKTLGGSLFRLGVGVPKWG